MTLYWVERHGWAQGADVLLTSSDPIPGGGVVTSRVRVVSGVVPQKLADRIALALQSAYDAGFSAGVIAQGTDVLVRILAAGTARAG